MDTNKEPITYYQPINKFVTMGDGTQYVFSCKKDISLCYVEPKHVESLLNKRGGCCGKKKKGIFRRATDQKIRLWNGWADR